MSRIVYNKLIRDRIPEIIERDNRKYAVVIIPPAEFDMALREKLVEEAQEAIKADDANLITELADIQEIILALMKLHRIDAVELETVRVHRLQKRGGFENRLKLLWTEQDFH
jgi:predicted house-cleaning noncanonical NTP pyrophosphatase (MazG superfamily)